MIDASEILKRVRKIEIKTKGLSKHIFSGEYNSAFKGKGMSFSEVRDYQYGDDVRNIDWNVTARTGNTSVKVFEEERELTVIFLIDLSKSAFFGTSKQFKSELMAEMSAVLAFSAMNNNDKVGAVFFSDRIEKYVPPKKGKKHILRIIRELLYLETEGTGTNIALALEYLNNVQKKRSIVFLMSDFMTKGYENALNIASRKHDIVGMHLYDKTEQSLPSVGIVRVRDAETGNFLEIDTSSKTVRKKYEAWYEENYNYFMTNFSKRGLDVMSLSTEDDYVKTMLKFFKKRGK